MEESIHITFIVLVDILALLQCVFLGSFLLYRSAPSKPSFSLGLYILLYGSDLPRSIMEFYECYEPRPWLEFLPTYFYFLIPVLLYFYARELTAPMSRAERKIYLVPAALESLVFAVLSLGILFSVVDPEKFTQDYSFFNFHFALSTVFTVLFMGLTVRVVRKHRKLLPDYYSNTDRRNLRWLEFLCYGVITLEMGWLLTEAFENYVEVELAVDILSLFNALIIFWASFQGLVQQSVSLSPEFYPAENEKDKCAEEPVLAFSLLLFNRLKGHMNESKPYLNADLQLHDLAKAMGETPRKISYAIGAHSETNFKGFVNAYRVREAQRLISSGSCGSITMLGIAFESGFRSKASFYSSFKRVSACSPGEYLKQKSTELGSGNSGTS